jgi:hypothetical protein
VVPRRRWPGRPRVNRKDGAIEPVNGRGEVVGQIKKWSAGVGLAAHDVAAEPQAKAKGVVRDGKRS